MSLSCGWQDILICIKLSSLPCISIISRINQKVNHAVISFLLKFFNDVCVYPYLFLDAFIWAINPAAANIIMISPATMDSDGAVNVLTPKIKSAMVLAAADP